MTGFIERTFRNGDGLTLNARDYAATADIGDRAPVICLHGLTRNSKDFEDVAPRIAALGRRVIAMDMRGRGRSDYDPFPARYVPATYAGDVSGWMEELKIPAAVFIGTSMGGMVTMILSALEPARVLAAVLNDVGPRLEQPALDRIAAYVSKRSAPAADWREAAERCKTINGGAFPDAPDGFWSAFASRTCVARNGGVDWDYDPNIAAPFAAAYSNSETKTPAPDLTPFFEALVKTPVLSVRGGISDLLSASGLDYMKSLAPQMKSVVVPNIGHAPFLTEPEAWTALSDFLAEAP